MRALVLAILCVPGAASAWDGSSQWWAPAHADNPGSGGIFGTGGEHDHRVTCLDCHVERDPTAAFDVTITLLPPALPMGEVLQVTPGQRYQVTLTMVGEDLAAGGAGCGQYSMHVNHFAATFEDSSGALAGVLESDSGQSSEGPCPNDWPYWPMGAPRPPGTTGLYRDCEVVFSRGDGDADQHRTTWTFFWTAPDDGRAVTMHYGVVDGDCMMKSMGDAVVVDELVLAGPSARRRAARTPIFAALAAVLLPLALALAARRRGRS
jgi:hypothetical protein